MNSGKTGVTYANFRPPVRSGVAFESLPPESPVAMPMQDFARKPDRSIPRDNRFGYLNRLALLFALSILPTLAAIDVMRDALGQNGFSAWDIAYLALFIPLFAWIAFGFATSLIGFILLCAREGLNSRGYRNAFYEEPEGRTAVLLPVCNEDFLTVIGRLSLMERSLERIVGRDRFDFFILSDSNPANGVLEEEAYAHLHGAFSRPVYYRRRAINTGRKPGNVAEWVQRFGGAYDYMIVLDADSVMGGKTMARLAVDMDRRPEVALLQTIPAVVGATTLFARWQQFASRLYGPMSSLGMIWWSEAQASFWGHNAIIRVKAFAESCGLPELSGPPPFGGHIMSHDMIEAALLRRNGWSVRMVMTDDSFEEFPPSLPDLAIRDRRWCQGNVQHVPLIPRIAGLHIVNRFHLIVGASAYLTSPMWLALILLVVTGQYFGAWSTEAILPSGGLLALTVVLLFGPKLLSLLSTIAVDERRRGFGGAGGLVVGAVLEAILSILTAPISMLTQTLNLFGILAGRKSAWNGQTRDCDGIPLRQSLRTFRYHVALGVLLLVGGFASGMEMLWLFPIVAGLLLSPLLASFTARKDLGRLMSRIGLFTVPNAWWQERGYSPLQTQLILGRSTTVWTAHMDVANDY